MKTYKIYGTSYPLSPTSDTPCDSYAYKGELLDDPPAKGKSLGFIEMDDGSVVECYKGKSKLPLILGIIVLLAAIAGAAYYFLVIRKPEVAIGGTMLSTSVEKDIITFNGIMAASDGQLDVRFVNGDYPATIEVSGEGIKTDVVSVAEGEAVTYIPVTVDTKENAVEVHVRITSNGTTSAFNAIVEIPDNMNEYDTSEGLNGYFSKELILEED